MNSQPPHPPTAPAQEPPAPPPGPPPPAGPPVPPSGGWHSESFETREVRKARERADRAARRADRAARRVHEAQERAGWQRSGTRQLVDAAGDAATAALTAVSAAADEAQARLAAKARMRELEHAVVTARAGGRVDVSPPTRDEALKLADRVEPGSYEASFVRGIGFIVAGVAALAMIGIGGFGLMGAIVPVAILMGAGSLGNRLQKADRSHKAGRLQLELARASLGSAEQARGEGMAATAGAPTAATAPTARRPRLIEDGDPRTRDEIVAVLDRLVANVRGLVPETDVATLQRIRESAALALPTTDGPLDLTDHDTWLLRQICIDYLPGSLEHFIALPADLASEPVLDGRSAREVLDEQLSLIESRLEEMATRTYQREAGGLLVHARFVADRLRPDPFQERLAELAVTEAASVPVAAPVPVAAAEEVHAAEAPVATSETAVRVRERA